jgi:phosphomannomutase
MAKDKLPLPDQSPEHLLNALAEQYADADTSTLDGLKINFSDSWVHVRPSNTEPILRVYTEAPTDADAQALADRFKDELQRLLDTLDKTE